jgi:alpha-tubulin suppressor-like RCC1 family protein
VTLPSAEVPVAVAVGEYVSCALAASGHVYCWGWDFLNALGAGSTVITQTCTTGDNDTAPCTGTPVQVAGLSDAKVLRSGGMTSCALDSVGHAYCWGNNSDGELGQTGTQPQTAPVEVDDPLTGEPYTFDDIAIGDELVCGHDGATMYCWGGGAVGNGQPENAPQTPTAVQF